MEAQFYSQEIIKEVPAHLVPSQSNSESENPSKTKVENNGKTEGFNQNVIKNNDVENKIQNKVEIIDNKDINFHRLVIKGGNADQIDDTAKQDFLVNFSKINYEELLKHKQKISYLEIRTVILACFCIFCYSSTFYSMSYV